MHTVLIKINSFPLRKLLNSKVIFLGKKKIAQAFTNLPVD